MEKQQRHPKLQWCLERVARERRNQERETKQWQRGLHSTELHHKYALLFRWDKLTPLDHDAEPWHPHHMPAASSSQSQSTATMKRQEFDNQDANQKTRLGSYYLGKTLGEGEFGKVRIGWKSSDSPQVAIKLIRREKLDSASRMAKVHREIAILKRLDHPHIVKLHEMLETSTTIGMVLEYASGGELFDYILQQRFLIDDKARRLFAQVVSGVGYLHKNGIIHRDLKLENLLLDSARNIIITDFGFANTFDPKDRRTLAPSNMAMHHIKDESIARVFHENQDGYKVADLMSTSCGSPCYAAPELVVREGLYSGRQVDVWSCGVILYAMLAGFLPFDDDPANPEGDNINQLYQYITHTTLTFPDYVGPQPQDLLRQMLKPNPEQRADLFHVAHHSYLDDHLHVMEPYIRQYPLDPDDDQPAAVPLIKDFAHPKAFEESGPLARESTKRFAYHGPGEVSEENEPAQASTPGQNTVLQTRQPATLRDKSPKLPKHKRRTVQVEYVAPKSSAQPKSNDYQARQATSMDEPSRPERNTDSRRVQKQNDQVASARSRNTPTGRKEAKPLPPPKVNAPTQASASSTPAGQRPSTAAPRTTPLSRGSMRKPAAPEVTNENAQGQVLGSGHPQFPVKGRGHKRSSTVGNLSEKLLRRMSSIGHKAKRPSADRTHPPTSMRPVAADDGRKSGESRRSFGFLRRLSRDAMSTTENRQSRRLSLFGGRQKGDSPPSTATSGGTSTSRPTPNHESPSNNQALPGTHKRFSDVYAEKHASTGAANRVMDWFRRRRN